MTELEDFHERRLIGALKALVELLRQSRWAGRQDQIEKWANWFEGDLADYLAAQGTPRQIARQRAVVEHVLIAFGGMSTFGQLRLTDETGEPLAEANQRLQSLSIHLWAAARSVQGMLVSAEAG